MARCMLWIKIMVLSLFTSFSLSATVHTRNEEQTTANSTDSSKNIRRRPVRDVATGTAQPQTNQADDVQYAVNKKGIKLTKEEYLKLDVTLQQMLYDDGFVNPDLDPKIAFISERTARTVVQGRSSGLTFVVQTENFDYLEDSGPQQLIQNPVEIHATKIDYVIVEMWNILDSGNELLSLNPFTVTHVTDVGGRNVTFDYEITPTHTYENGVLNISSLANIAEFEAAINKLTYENTREEPTAILRGVKIIIHQGLDTAAANIYFDVVNVNDSPYFSEQPAELTIHEDDLFSQVISSTSIPFLADVYVDNDFNPQMGIAVLGADNTNGEWKYTDSNFRFVTIPDGVRDDQGNILRNTSLTQTSLLLYENYIAFIPNPNFHGQTSLTVVGWDRTGTSASLNHGSYTNVTWYANGPFSKDMATVVLTVSPVNDAPTVSSLESTVMDLANMEEDSDVVPNINISQLTAVCGDEDLTSSNSASSIGIAVTGVDGSNGVWQYTLNSGAVWSDIGRLALLLNGDESQSLRFVANGNFSGTAKVTFRCWDLTLGSSGDTEVDASYAGATGSFSDTEVTGIVTVLNTNDAPYFLNNDMSLSVYRQADKANEAGSLIGGLLLNSFRDVDPSDHPGLAVVKVVDHGMGEFRYQCPGASSTTSWFPFVFVQGPGHNPPHVTPSPSHATLLSSSCYLRFMSNATLSAPDIPYVEVLAWDGNDGLVAGSFGVNALTSSTNSYGKSVASITVVQVEPDDRLQLLSSTDQLTYVEGSEDLAIFQDVVLSEQQEVRYEEISVQLVDPLDSSHEQLKIGSSYGYGSEADLTDATRLDVTWSSDHTSILLLGNVSRAECQAATRSLTYVHTSQNPTPTARHVEISVVSKEGIESDVHILTLSVVAVNNQPRLAYKDNMSPSYIPFYLDNSSHVAIYNSSSILMDDPDNSGPAIVKIRIDVTYDGILENLSIPENIDIKLAINTTHSIVKNRRTSWTYDNMSATMTLTLLDDDATFADYASALGQVTYNNVASDPNPTSRHILLSIFDAAGMESNSLETVVLFTDPNTTTVATTTTPLPSTSSTIEHLSPAPRIARTVAFPYTSPGTSLHTDAKLSSGDEIRIIFDVDTNMAPHGVYDANDPNVTDGKTLQRKEVDELFQFSSPLVEVSVDNAYVGQWMSSRVFRITILNEGYPQASVKIGSWNLAPRSRVICAQDHDSFNPSQKYCIRDPSGKSSSSSEISAPLEGNWGLNTPSLTSVVMRNVTHREGESCVRNGTYTIMSFRPALSSNQLVLFCSFDVKRIFGSAVVSEFVDINFTISDCGNHYIADWDEAMNKSGGVPTVTSLRVVFNEVNSCHKSSLVSASLARNFDRSLLAQVVTETTGVTSSTLSHYEVSNANLKQHSLLAEQNSDLTPFIASWLTSKPAFDVSTSNDLAITSGDEITINFDRETNEPPVDTNEKISKILSVTPNCDNFYGEWKSSRTLRIILSNISSPVEELKIEFRENVFEDQTSVPNGFLNAANCIGEAVCGTHNTSVGICNSAGTSCRVHGSFFVRHYASHREVVNPSHLIPWWWLLVTGLLLLISLICLAVLGRHIHRKQDDLFSSPCVTCDWSECRSESKSRAKSFRYPSETNSTPAPLFSKRGNPSDGPQVDQYPASVHCTRKITPCSSPSVFSISAISAVNQSSEPSLLNSTDDVRESSQTAEEVVVKSRPFSPDETSIADSWRDSAISLTTYDTVKISRNTAGAIERHSKEEVITSQLVKNSNDYQHGLPAGAALQRSESLANHEKQDKENSSSFKASRDFKNKLSYETCPPLVGEVQFGNCNLKSSHRRSSSNYVPSFSQNPWNRATVSSVDVRTLSLFSESTPEDQSQGSSMTGLPISWYVPKHDDASLDALR